MQEIINQIACERKNQDDKWGEQNHSVCEWMTILGEEVGEACQEALRIRFGAEHKRQIYIEDLRKELIQCAAVCVAAIECLDRGNV